MSAPNIADNWLPEREPPSFADYKCPVCDGIEHVSNLATPLMHKHRYGPGILQTGFVILVQVPKV